MLQSLWNPFRDWNILSILKNIAPQSFKASETLLGFETKLGICDLQKVSSFKASETLLGIETTVLPTFVSFT